MATRFEPNERSFERVLRQPKVEQLVDDVTGRALDEARASAPVVTGAYKDGLHIEHRDGRYRRTAMVVGGDVKTMLLESKLGILARALKAAKR